MRRTSLEPQRDVHALILLLVSAIRVPVEQNSPRWIDNVAQGSQFFSGDVDDAALSASTRSGSAPREERSGWGNKSRQKHVQVVTPLTNLAVRSAVSLGPSVRSGIIIVVCLSEKRLIDTKLGPDCVFYSRLLKRGGTRARDCQEDGPVKIVSLVRAADILINGNGICVQP